MLPNILPKRAGGSSQSDSHNMAAIPSSASSSASESRTKRSVRISAACQACKKRKARVCCKLISPPFEQFLLTLLDQCSGGPPPCANCQVTGGECIIDIGLDGRRKASTHRLQEELDRHKQLLQITLQAVGDLEVDQRQSILERLRHNPDLADIPQSVGLAVSPIDKTSIKSPITPVAKLKTEVPFAPEGRSTPSESSSYVSTATQQWQDAREQLSRYETLLTMLLNAPIQDVSKILGRLRSESHSSQRALSEGDVPFTDSFRNLETVNASDLAEIVQKFLENRNTLARQNQDLGNEPSK